MKRASISRRTFLKATGAWAGSWLLAGLGINYGIHAAEGDHAVFLPAILNAASAQNGNALRVGPTRTYKKPSEAAAVAQDNDVIEIDAGVYAGDVATWTQNNLTLRGVNGKAHLQAGGQNAGGKGIWVIQGNNTVVENIEFSGATVPDQNGAGIRQEGANLTVRACYFHDNEEGILAGDNADSEILIEYTEFGYNGYGDGYTHNLYINHIKKFTLQYCYSHHAIVGHLVKSRAYENHILYNRIMDEADGNASYEIDLPNGGACYLIGNLVQQGPATENSTIVTFAEEGGTNPIQTLYAINNTIVNDRSAGGIFLRVTGTPVSLVANNLVIGNGAVYSGTVTDDHNVQADGRALVNRSGYDYHLAAGSPAIDAGRDPGTASGIALAPAWEYVSPLGRVERVQSGVIDVGAYEYHT